jgi:hypothetical protein
LRAPHLQGGNLRPPHAHRTSGPRFFPDAPLAPPQTALPKRAFGGSVPFIPAEVRLDFLSAAGVRSASTTSSIDSRAKIQLCARYNADLGRWKALAEGSPVD